jgi:putative aldouronate transport system permease protein
MKQTLTLPKKNWRISRFIWKYRYIHLLALPGILYFFVFKYLPMYGIIMAFKNYRGIGGFPGIWRADWAGLIHFKNFFTGIYFQRLFRNTLVLSMLRLTFGFTAPIILALLMNELYNVFFKRVVQTISYMPYFLSWVVTSGIIITLCSPSEGPINFVIKSLGKEAIFFVSDTKYFRGLLIITDIWKNIGWGTIVYLAAISGIDPGYYEAATIDGANRWQKARHITLPGMSEIIAIMFILSAGHILDQNFEQIFNLYSPAVYEVADVFETYVYRTGIVGQNFSFTTAVGLFKSVVSLFMVILCNSLAKKLGTEGLW